MIMCASRPTKPRLTVEALQTEAAAFAKSESDRQDPKLYGVTDGKAIGTYLEHRFRERLRATHEFDPGSSAKGIDFPTLDVDLKVTNIRQPQSSSPFRSARQKIYGLGYSLLIFVYRKIDDDDRRTGTLEILHTVFVDASRTADYQTTSGIREILDNNGNIDDLTAFMEERALPVDDIQAARLADEMMKRPPALGYLTISNALQWRLQYRRVIASAGSIDGIIRIE